MTATKIQLDEELIELAEQAKRLGGQNTLDEAAAEALKEYLQAAYAEIEKCLTAHAKVEECCVMWDNNQFKAVVRLKGQALSANKAHELEDGLIKHCSENLSRFAPPESVKFTDEKLPRTQDGEIDCDAVRRQYAGS